MDLIARMIMFPIILHCTIRENMAWSKEKGWWIVPDDEISTESIR